MTYTMGDHRRSIHELAIANGWTEAPPLWSDTELWERRESQIALVWTERDTLTHASINIQGSAGRIPARPRMAMVTARDWFSAPGEPGCVNRDPEHLEEYTATECAQYRGESESER